MRCVVTGAAGFIGSHLCEDLLARGHTVVGIDAFVPNYPPAVKAENQAVVLAHPNYHFHAADLRRDNLAPIVTDADVVFHLAAVPGPPQNWADSDDCWSCNVQGTLRLLDAVRQWCDRLGRFVFASSSSVYGTLAVGPEDTPPRPVSPYGVTKLAAEHLCRAYADLHGLPVVTLRYFAVYGPRQRPDMACHRFVRALIRGEPIEVYGDGRQVRAWTYVADCVAATAAAVAAPAGEVYNVGGGEAASVLDLIQRLETIAGTKTGIVFKPVRVGDPRQAVADTTKLRNHIGWRPATSLDDGLARQWAWQSQADPGRPPAATTRPTGRPTGRRKSATS
jgi:nucleoside-diphosphate-sugar epimerase